MSFYGRIPLLLPLATLHIIFAYIFILSKKQKTQHNMIGCAWLGFVYLSCIRRSLHIAMGTEAPALFMNIVGYPLTYGPFLYLYTRSLTQPDERLRLKDLLHFLPFLISIPITFLPIFDFANIRIDAAGSPPIETIAFGLAAVLSLGPYIVLSQKLLKRHSENLDQHFSYHSNQITLTWLSVLCWIFFTVCALEIGVVILSLVREIFPSYRIVGGMLLGFLYFLSFFMMRQGQVFIEENSGPQEVANVSGEKEKYAKSGLSDERLTEIAHALISYMDSSKAYLKEDLGLGDVASGMKISESHLSQALNARMQKNFYMFINEYRLAEVKSRLNDSRYSEFSILRIALDCGFNSKSTFNAIFRKMTGLTPMEFRAGSNQKSA